MTPRQKLIEHLQKHGQNMPWKELNELYNPGASDSWAKSTAFHAGWNKVKDEHEALLKECEEKGIPIESVGHYWYKGEHFSIHVKKEQEVQISDVVRGLIEEMKSTRKIKTDTCLSSTPQMFTSVNYAAPMKRAMNTILRLRGRG
jgi:hypothetical protein